jgi:hypothetical protein
MRRRTNRRKLEDHTGVAFSAAAILGFAIVAVAEDMLGSATGVPLWTTWHFHPVSIFAGTLGFVGLLYFLQRMNDRLHANEYVAPYLPLLVLAGANILLKQNAAWLLPVAAACLTWSLGRLRRMRSQRALPRRT